MHLLICFAVDIRWMAPGRPFGKGAITLAGDAAHPMTPNLGQGGCVALEDGVVLARLLKPALMMGDDDPSHIAAALRDFERERSRRAFPLTVRSNVMGALLQLAFPPVVAVRNALVPHLPVHEFLNHANFDCGRL